MSDPGFILHPEAAQDITEIWEYIASGSPQAARRVRESLVPVQLARNSKGLSRIHDNCEN